MNHIEGTLTSGDERYAIVVSRYNESVTRRLLDGATETFRHHGTPDENLTVAWVPGAFEIPLVAERFAKSGRYAAVCCLGAVVKGETTHDDYINREVSHAIMQMSRESGIPVLFGLLTCQTMQQATDRAGGRVGNKGSEVALAAIEMVSVLKQVSEDDGSPQQSP